MARRRVTESADDGLEQIEAWYRYELTRPAEPPWKGTRWEPVCIGPTWQTDGRHWLLPDRTLGWGVLAWCGRWLQERQSVPWRFTLEQARFILHWYAVDEDAAFLSSDGVFQRLKGHGKDPLGGALSMAEMNGPARVVDLVAGQPVGGRVDQAWVQTAAVSLDQTQNTMKLLPSLISDEARAAYDLQVQKTQVWGDRNRRVFEAVTSSPAKLEGARSTFVLLNETHHWRANNNGHEMAAVLERNSTKSADGAARTLRITNAYEPGLNSTAEHDREAYEAVQAGRAVDVGLLYDSLEAHPDAPLTVEAAPEVVVTTRGDSVWLSADRIVRSITDVRNPPSRSRRFWYNQVRAAEDARFDPLRWDVLQRPDLTVEPAEEIVLFFDGSKSDDGTALVGCRLSDGHVFVLGYWQRPPGERGEGWLAPREKVDAAVIDAWETYRVVAFWGDPSHTRDDETLERYWDDLFDTWHRRYGKRINPKLWAVKAKGQENPGHSIAWDMASPARTEAFTAAVERFDQDLTEGDLSHDGDVRLRQHVRNAKRALNQWGVSLRKEHRESTRKIDLAVCAIGARMLRRLVLNSLIKRRGGGKVW